MKRVVITGMGALTPIGNNLKDYWQASINGVSGAAAITKFDTAKHKTQFACELKNIVPADFFEKGEARRYDLFTQYALIAVQEAVNDSGILLGEVNKDKIGVIWASGNGGISTFDEQMGEYFKGDETPRFNPFFMPKILVDMASGIIAMKHGLRGINYTAVSACASSNSAMMDAFNYIRWGKANAIITGGSEAPITPSAIGGFNACKALSLRNNSPGDASRPFDKSRDGFVMGEGSGAFIFEEYEHAKKRGAKIYAEVVGAGMSADAYHLTATHPEGLGAILGMTGALEDAQLNTDQIDYVNMHATSTPVGDISEIKALHSLFKDHLFKMNLSATKSLTGHLLGAAGAIEGIVAVLSLKNQVVTPTINTQEIDEAIPAGINLTLHQPQERKIDYVLSNTFGFGGHNASVIFKRFQ
jgi:3-oxoacyl-[acyl-carrier-protein] synthase II